MITTSGFSVLARFTGKAGGIDDLHIAEYPGPLGIHETSEIEQNIANVLIERIVTGLTSTTGGTKIKSTAALDPKSIIFTGTAEGAAERHYRHRSVPHPGRPLLHHADGRTRRAGDQGGAPGQG